MTTTLTATIAAYSFAELSAEARAAAIEHTRADRFEDSCLSILMGESIDQVLADRLIGPDATLPADLSSYWSLSWGQGDGVALEGTLTRDQAPALAWPALRDACTGRFARASHARIRHSGHHFHEYSFTVDIVDENGDEHDAPAAFVEELRDACRAAERAGYDTMDWWTSDEVIAEDLADSDRLFDERGNVVPYWFAA